MGRPQDRTGSSTWGDPKTALTHQLTPLALLGETPRPQWLLYLGRPQDRTGSPFGKSDMLPERGGRKEEAGGGKKEERRRKEEAGGGKRRQEEERRRKEGGEKESFYQDLRKF